MSPCSADARERGDAVVGTAPPASRWLLLEQDGGWGSDAAASVQAPPEHLARLDGALAAASARLELIRRPGRDADSETAEPVGPTELGSFERATAAAASGPDGRPRRWCVVDARLGVEVWGVRDADGGFGGALEALADPLAHGAVRGRGVLLVCAHGKHDACCAVRGRPVAAALAERWPALTWECTHLGGDRFAANLAIMPDGVLYGYLSPEDAVALVEAHRARTPRVRQLRGIVGRPSSHQAALIAAAPLLGVAPWDRRLTVSAAAPGPDWVALVRMGEVRVEVRGHDVLTEPAQLTCGARQLRSALVPVVDAVALRP